MKQSYPEKRMLWDISEEEENAFLTKSKLFSRQELCDGLHTAITEYGTAVSDKVAVMTRYQGNAEYVQYAKADFEFLIKGTFEGREIPIPVGYENCLKKEYGEEFYYYPEIMDRKPHHIAIYDTSKSYVDYLMKTGYNE